MNLGNFYHFTPHEERRPNFPLLHFVAFDQPFLKTSEIIENHRATRRRKEKLGLSMVRLAQNIP